MIREQESATTRGLVRVAIVLVTLVVTGCAGGGVASSAAVERSLRVTLSALAHGEGNVACAHMTMAQQRRGRIAAQETSGWVAALVIDGLKAGTTLADAGVVVAWI
jgi:hypothetical protein